MRITPERAGDLVAAARDGDSTAWAELVDAFVGLIWAITRAHRLDDGSAQDVSQTTWLRLVENLDRLSDPQRVGAWLATTARRECLRVLRQPGRYELLDGAVDLDGLAADGPPVDADLLRGEQTRQVQAALAQLPDGCRVLLGLLVLEPAPTYEEIAASLAMPVGSIGPTRARCLAKLRALLAEDDDGVPRTSAPTSRTTAARGLATPSAADRR